MAGLLKLDLVEETALEGFVHIGGEVGGGDEDAIELLHLLEDDVLDGILHLVDTARHILESGADDGIGLIEE